eukprot:340444_1
MSQSSCALHACAEYNSLDFLKYLFEIISADNSQFVMKQNNEKQNEWYGYTGLMIAATKCNIKCCQLILDHLKYDGKLLNQVLKMKNNNHATALELASISTYKNNTKCVQTIIEYYANDDIESVFTPCVQLGDLQMVQSIWNKAGNDIAIQNKLLSAIDKDNNNCFLLAAKNGNEACLEWLLTLNQEEAERLVMQKHIENGMTALILAVSNDDRRKDEYKMEERRNYFECVQLMFDAAKNKKELLFEVDNNHKNALMYSCANANIQTTTYLLSQIDEKDQTLIIEREDTNKYNCFHYSVMGGNIDLVRRIFKDKSLMEDDKALLLSLQNGYIDITEWILFSILHDTNQKVMFLNQTIGSSKSGRQFETRLKQWISRIVDKEIERIDDVNDIAKIFSWLLTHDPVDIVCIKLILSKLPKDNYSKAIFMKETKCISYASKNNQMDVLPELLGYLQNFSDPLFYGAPNALGVAVVGRSDKCATFILEFIKSKKVKDSLISACVTKNQNALQTAANLKSDKMIQ